MRFFEAERTYPDPAARDWYDRLVGLDEHKRQLLLELELLLYPDRLAAWSKQHHRAEEHRLRLLQDLGCILGAHAAVRLVPVAAPRIFLPAELDVVLRADCLEHAHAFWYDFPADAVAGNDCDSVLGHGKILTLQSRMRFAALETSTDWCSVALWQDGEIRALERRAPNRHSEHALPMLESLMKDAGRLDARLLEQPGRVPEQRPDRVTLGARRPVS